MRDTSGRALMVIGVTVDTSRAVWGTFGNRWENWGAPILVLARDIADGDDPTEPPMIYVFTLTGDGDLSELRNGVVLPAGQAPSEADARLIGA